MEPLARASAALSRHHRTHLAAVALVVFAFVQAPGRIVGDTKADLVIDPSAFLARALTVWNARQGFGQLGNQSYGYLFPMGPFFLLGHLIALPAWITQRLWWVLVLLTAYYGTLRLARALGIGTQGSRIAAGLAYAVAPRVLTVLGGISVEAWPGALVPWALVPLVLARTGHLPARRAAALSAAAALAMGAVNAAATFAALLVPVVYLLVGLRCRAGGRLLLWWSVSTGLAVAWWLGPLLILGRYGFPFLDYIENARITTSTTDPLDTLRGAEHWGGYLLSAGVPRWPAGFELSYGLLAVLATCVVAAAGLAGLCRADMPGSRWLRVSAAIGLVTICAGHAGPFGGGASAAVQAALDGPLAALRNVHKLDPLVRLPLALGVGHALGLLLRADRRPVELPAALSRRRASRATAATSERPPVRVPATTSVALAAALLALTAAILPGLRSGVVPPGTYAGVPAYWHRVASWLAERAPDGSSLLVPSSNFADYAWGAPQDEPLQALARSDWAVRDAVPLGAPGTYRILDGIDAVLAAGRPAASIAPALARLGVHYLVLRNDLDWFAAGAEQPRVVRAALVGSPGVHRVATFGPHAAVEVFTVAGTTPAVSAPTVSSSVALSGGPEGTVGAASALGPGRASVLLPDVGAAVPGGVVVTDTGRRRSLGFGYSAVAPRIGADGTPLDVAADLARYSPTLPSSADPAGGRPAAEFGPVLPRSQQTVSVLAGLRSVTASDSAADPFATFYRDAADRPEAAFDGNRHTAWVSASTHAVGSWLQARFLHPVDVPDVAVRFLDHLGVGPGVATVDVRTDTGTRRVAVARGGAVQQLPVPRGPTTSLRITVTAVRARSDVGQVGIAEVAVPGLLTVPELVTARSFPSAVTGLPTAIRLDRTAGNRASCVLSSPTALCSNALAHQGEEVVPYLREVRTPGPVGASVTASVRAGGPASALAAAVDRLLPVRASVSSARVAALAGGAQAVLDGDPTTDWTPTPKDRRPVLRLHFAQDQAGRRAALRGDFSGAKSVEVSSAGRTVTLRPRRGRLPSFELPGRSWTVTVNRRAHAGPVRVAALELDGRAVRPSGEVRVPCGTGPSISVDGIVTALSVVATVRQVLSGAEVTATACGPRPQLSAGDHEIRFGDTAAWWVQGVGLGVAELPAAQPRAVHVTSSDSTHVSARVAAGPAAFLQLSTSDDSGWHATLGATVLRPVRLDGWRQGFVLPAGRGGRVTVVFGPEALQRASLAAGAGGLLVLGVVGVLPGRIRPVPREPQGRPARRRRRISVAAAVLAAAVLGWLVAGTGGLVLAAAVTAAPTRWQWRLAAGAMVAAGVSAVVLPGSVLALFCAAVAAGALLAATLRPDPSDDQPVAVEGG